jgi:hypothetical protein
MQLSSIGKQKEDSMKQIGKISEVNKEIMVVQKKGRIKK